MRKQQQIRTRHRAAKSRLAAFLLAATAATGTYGLYAAATATVGETEYSTVAAALDAATASDAVVLNMTGETVDVDSITAASLTINGNGTINVTGDVNVSSTLSFSPDAATTAIITAHPYYTIKLAAANVTAATLSGAATIEISGALTADAGLFYGSITGSGAVHVNGSLVLQGPSSFSGGLNIASGGAVSLSKYDYSSLVAYNMDASSSTCTLTYADGSDTLIQKAQPTVGRKWTFTAGSSPSAFAEVITNDDYFGGKRVMQFNDGANYSYDGTSSAKKGILAWTIMVVYQRDAAPTDGNEYICQYNTRSQGLYLRTDSTWGYTGNDNSGASKIYVDGQQKRTFDRGKKSIVTLNAAYCGNSNNGSYNRSDSIGNNYKGVIAEVIGFALNNANRDQTPLSVEQRAAVEAYMMQKWDLTDKATMQTIPSTAGVSLDAGSTLDLGAFTMTVKTLSGSGTVQNGTLTVTDAINLAAGDVLTLPNTATFTLGKVAAKIEDTTAGTVTLCGSLADAISAYSTGTLTILQSLTDVNLGTTEISISGIVLADGVSAPTFAANPPFTASYDSETGTLANTRSAATFIYTGDTAYSPVSGNFKIGEVATASVPGADDKVQFDTATSIYIGSEDIQYAAFILNADVTVTGAGTNYLRVNSYTGTGTLKLAGYGYLAPTTDDCTIACPLDVSGENKNRLHIADSSSYFTTVTGKMTGSGILELTKWRNDGYSGHHFACDGSEFYGTINEVQPSNANASRNTTYFGNTDFSNAKVYLTNTGKNDGGLRFYFSSGSSEIKFGSLNGDFMSSASGATRDIHATIEIGNLNLNDTIEGNWMAGNTGRNPYLRKVGTGTLTTSVTDTYGYILNGGTLVVMAAAAQKDVTTELAGYEVVSTPNYDTDGETVLSTTYTLESNKITWTGEGGDSNWTTAGNWSSGTVPTATDFVVFEGDAEVVVPTWATSMCKYMTVNGNVTLAGAALTDNCFCLDVHGGYIDGRGTLTLKNCGLWNATTSANVVISVDVAVESTGNRAQFSRIESDNGTFTLTGDVAVGEGAKLKLKNATATEPEIALGVGAWLVVPSNSSVTTGNIVVTGGGYFETTDGTDTAYVNNTASTWIGGASGNWNTAAKWSSGVLPRDDTVVTFGAIAADAGYSTYTVGISNNSWDSWYDRDKCKSMVLNAPVTLANVGSATGGYLAVYGDITGDANGSLTLNAIGLDNASWNPAATVNVTCPFYVDGSSASACWFAARDVGFNITGAGVYALLNMYCPVTVGTLTIGNNAWLNIGANRTMAVTTLVVADGATATISPDEATSTLTAPSPVSQTPQYSVTTSTSGLNVTYTSSLTGVVPGASTVFTDETAANNASVVLTAAQKAQGLQPNYYKKEVYESDGSWYVRAVLDDSVVGVDLGEEATAAVSGSAVTITVTNLKPGLCYRVVSGDSASGMTTKGAWSDYYDGSNAPTLSAALPDSGVMYYSVEASDTK